MIRIIEPGGTLTYCGGGNSASDVLYRIVNSELFQGKIKRFSLPRRLPLPARGENGVVVDYFPGTTIAIVFNDEVKSGNPNK